MPKLPRLKAKEAEKRLLQAGFIHIRSQGSHRIYQLNTTKVVVPFHGSKILHPKIIKQIMNAIENE